MIRYLIKVMSFVQDINDQSDGSAQFGNNIFSQNQSKIAEQQVKVIEFIRGTNLLT